MHISLKKSKLTLTRFQRIIFNAVTKWLAKNMVWIKDCGVVKPSCVILHDASASSSCIYFLIEAINWIEFHVFPIFGRRVKALWLTVRCKCRSMECKMKFMWVFILYSKVGEYVCVCATMIASQCKVEYKRDLRKQRADIDGEIEKRTARENRIYSSRSHATAFID